ncbi:MAG: regulatory protein GemA [Desulfuromonadaceae bacterium]
MALTPYKQRTAAEQWNADRPRIHALKNKVMATQPGYGDDNYRDTILDISKGRTDSSKELSPRERQELISRLSRLAGEEPRPAWLPRDKRSYPKRPKNMDKHGESRDDQLGKIEALLTVGKKSWAYADGCARRICKVDKVQWVETHDLYKIIAALTYQAKREGWDLSGAK